ncbi:hypothetical protein BDZ94DRAFT_896823 [Collybia nuda]|uniref:Uncharacterized protein n=1 Tax=Collybia nuda TaxID=64659 RepID=A0A9P5Y3J2_9AGAR|nr:hypothetical protein BDZ94DRAFT_896823 [Collybia nuda]
MTASDSKTAEFARLFDLFERLASRKSRAINDENRTTTLDDIPSLPVPPDLVPVVKSLTSLMSTRRPVRGKEGKGRGHRDATSLGVATHDIDSEDEDEVSLPNFPLGKKYPFTFKMMLYKLYQLDDWAEKVKQVLERSQIEYKPLAEAGSNVAVDGKEVVVEEKPSGRVHFKVGVASGGPRRPYARPRSYSVLIVGKARDIGTAPMSPGRARRATIEDTRAVKKRCVGRRKSISGPLTAGAGMARSGEGWIYDAAVSSFESTAHRETGVFVAPGPQARSRYQSLGETRKAGKGNEGGRIMARNRALSVIGHSKPFEMKQILMKRPFGL